MSNTLKNWEDKFWHQKLARKSHSRNILHKRKLKLKNRRISHYHQEKKFHSVYYNKETNENTIFAPRICSLVKNTDDFCKFISDINFFFDYKKPVFVNMKAVEEIDDTSILVLLSIMMEFKSQHIEYNGNYPKNERAKSKFKNSQFFKYLNAKQIEDDQYDLNSLDNQIITHANKNVDPDLAARLIKDSTTFLWGKEKWCKGAYRTIIELMQNTNNHAVIGKRGEKHWWLSISKNPIDKHVQFSFIDYGVGIFTSLKHKKSTSWLKQTYDNLQNQLHSNCDIMKKMLSGQLSNTSTGEIYRGKGIPGIKEVLDRNGISSLLLITNDAYCDVSNNVFKELPNKINGTFFYWELNLENVYHEKRSDKNL